MSAKINHIVVHSLNKEQYKPIEQSQIREAVLDPENEYVQKLVDSLIDVYGTRYNTAQYGVFADGAARGSFPDQFESYAKLNQVTNASFLTVAKEAMNRLYQQASQSPAASGGYIVFADFENQGKRYFLIVMVKEKPGLALSEKLEPAELMMLDLSRVHQGARINFAHLKAFKNATPEEQQELRYLSFITPRSAQETAGYFVTALGCVAGAEASRATDTVLREGKRLFRETKSLHPNREGFEIDLLAYFESQKQSKQPVSLTAVVHLVQKHIPLSAAEEAKTITDDFIAKLNSDECQVPPEFSVHSSTLKRHTHITGKASAWSLAFDRQALGTTQAAQVFYNPEQKTLTVRELPEKMIQQVEAELAEQQGKDKP